MSTRWRVLPAAPRFMPLVGALIGAAGGGVYWVGSQIWPTSVAVVLAMLATALLSRMAAIPDSSTAATGGANASGGATAASLALLWFVFAILVKYNALMALSAANLPFALPANLALGLIMIAGTASSLALVVSARPVTHADIGIALLLGFAPAALIGIPGLIGLVAAIVARIIFVAYIRRNRPIVTAADLGQIQQITEVCFYLGALAARTYV
jgi:adenosylcobinamide-GDP ribazoletransferase